MISVDVEQGSPEWHAARLGIPTASGFSRIITPTGKASTQASTYRLRLLAEWMTGAPLDEKPSDWMLRGLEMEGEARDWYAMHADAEPKQVGLIYRDESRLVACSPDALVGDDGGLEIKCPAPHTHVGYLLDGQVPSEYVPQIQGCMYVTGRAWWDFASYHPAMPPLLIRVERDSAYIDSMAVALDDFIARLLSDRERLTKRGYVREAA